MTTYFQTKETKQYLFFYNPTPIIIPALQTLLVNIKNHSSFYEKRYGEEFNTFKKLLTELEDHIVQCQNFTHLIPGSLCSKVERSLGIHANAGLPAPQSLVELKSTFNDTYLPLLNYLECRIKLKKIVAHVLTEYKNLKDAYAQKVRAEEIKKNHQDYYKAYQIAQNKAKAEFPYTHEDFLCADCDFISKNNLNKIKKLMDKNEITDPHENKAEEYEIGYILMLSDKDLWYAEKDYLFAEVNSARVFGSVNAAAARAKKLSYQNYSIVKVKIEVDMQEVHHFGNKGQKMQKMIVDHEKKQITDLLEQKLKSKTPNTDTSETPNPPIRKTLL